MAVTTSRVPPEIWAKINELEEELHEGDITQQGFDKKKAKLLAPYINADREGAVSACSNSSGRSISPVPPSHAHTNHISAGHTAAVVSALERSFGQQEENHTPHRRLNLSSPNDSTISPSTSFDTSSGGGSRTGTPLRTPGSPPPPVQPKPVRGDSRKHYQQQQQQREIQQQIVSQQAQGGVSQKIQQLLNTLKRPKKNRRPIEEYYQDNDEATPVDDPSAPRPIGPLMTPATGVPLESRQEWHRNIEAAIQHHSTTLSKQPAISVVEPNGKATVVATYSKLAIRAQKVAHYILNKFAGGKAVQPGDRIALLFRNDEPGIFAAAFFGCIFAALIPVAIEPPVTKEDPGGQQIGFLLNSLGITVAMISEATAKHLFKDEGKDVHFKGWPKLSWFMVEHLSKPSKDWTPPTRPAPESAAYIEYSTADDGSSLGVTVTRNALLTHCRSLTTACLYREGEVVVCTEDPKRSIGLWHGILAAAYNGLHVIFVPPSVMVTMPVAWLHMVQKYKASCVLASSRTLSGCISLANHRELRDVSLQGVRMLLLEDGANPWSLASSDLFYESYAPKGLTREALCPCSGSPAALTVSLRRPSPKTPSGRGVMSISCLSYGVVRVEEPGSITSLTLQDVGMVMPGARIVVVAVNGPPVMCRSDEVGEICVQSAATGSGFWGLPGKTANVFQVRVESPDGPAVQGTFTRSGLLGFVGEGGLVFICGTMKGLIQIAGRRHNTEDLIATIMAVEPHSFIYRGRIVLFSVTVYKEERVVVVAEQKPNCSDEEAFTWMNSVVPAVESIHGVNLYGIVLVSPGKLPKRSSGVVCVHETKHRFIEGQLHPVNLLMCPHQCVNNLPVPKQQPTMGVAAQMIGDLVTGRITERVTDFSTATLEESTDSAGPGNGEYLSAFLRWRAQDQTDTLLFTLVDSKGHPAKTMSSIQLHKKAERMGSYLVDKLKLNSGDHAALVFHPGLDLIIAFFGCLYVGVTPVVIQPPATSNLHGSLPALKMITELSNSRVILSTHNIIKLLRSKEVAHVMDLRSLPPMYETEDLPRKKLDKFYKPPTPELIAYLDFTVSTTGVLSGVKVSHAAVMSMCKYHKQVTELYPSREIAVCLDPYSGLGLVLWCLSSIYAGHHSILINPWDLEQNPLLWLTVLSNNKVRDTYCSYSVIDLCCREIGTSVELLKNKGIDLSAVATCVVVSEERPRVHLLNSFKHLFSMVGLSTRCVSASFGCRVNPVIGLQGPQHPEPTFAYVDYRALRLDRLVMLEKGSPNSLCLMESAKVLPSCHVMIVNPETKTPCAHTDLGEIWVSSAHNGSGFYGLKDEINDSLSQDHFHSTLSSGTELNVEFARTGYLGFLVKSDKTDQFGVPYNSLYVVGSVDESLKIRGFRYQPVDLEASVIRCHKNICGSAVFSSNKLLVVVAELHGSEEEALNIVPVITTTLLEEHQLVTGIVVVVDPGTILVNSRGEKQRIHLRDSFLADEIDPIYVAYNL